MPIDGPSPRTIVCRNVLERGKPVLFVSHDEVDEWQMLCGIEHHGDDAEDPEVVDVATLVARDASLAPLLDLPLGWMAERERANDAWLRSYAPDDDDDDEFDDDADEAGDLATLTDEERGCVESVRRVGLHILQVAASETDDGFSYSVGLYDNFEHPELVVFGRKEKWLGWLLNHLAVEIRAGARYVDGVVYDKIIPEGPLRFRAVTSSTVYRDYLGWDLWYYTRFKKTGAGFPVLQVVYPDVGGRYPGDPGYAGDRQPPLP